MSPVERRKAWARRFIAAAPDAPLYGSEEWLSLREGPAKVAAVVKAAEARMTEFEDELANLRAELLFTARQAKRAEDAAYVVQRDQWRREWDVSWRPHPANRANRKAS